MTIREETPELLRYLRTVLRSDPSNGHVFWLSSPSRRYKAGNRAGSNRAYSCVSIRRDGLPPIDVRVSRMIWAFEMNRWPANEIDHRDRNPRNNSFSNLREATDSQNGANKAVRRSSVSGLKGVRLHRKTGLWNARIGAEGKSLGYFKTSEDAYAAYVKAAINRFGEFACV